MKKITLTLVLMLITGGLGCHKNVQAPVPGSINAFDAWAFRVVDDSDAAVHQAKTWFQCTEAKFPVTILVDDRTEICNPSHVEFPMQFKGDLNSAIDALNVAKTAGTAYHAGGSNDQQGLVDAVTKLSIAVGNLVAHIGGIKQ